MKNQKENKTPHAESMKYIKGYIFSGDKTKEDVNAK